MCIDVYVNVCLCVFCPRAYAVYGSHRWLTPFVFFKSLSQQFLFYCSMFRHKQKSYTSTTFLVLLVHTCVQVVCFDTDCTVLC